MHLADKIKKAVRIGWWSIGFWVRLNQVAYLESIALKHSYVQRDLVQ